MRSLPRIVAHRGASLRLPDNSRAAFEAAVAAGADALELDVRTARGGELVLVHDARVGGRRVGELGRGELDALLGHPVVTLVEVIELAAAASVRLDVELKEPEASAALALLAATRPDGLVVTSFHDAVVAAARAALGPGARCGLLLGTERPRPYVRTRASELLPAGRARACDADHVALHVRLAELGAARRARRAGLDVLVWTVDLPAALDRWLADPDVDGVITDDPALARERAARTGCHASRGRGT